MKTGVNNLRLSSLSSNTGKLLLTIVLTFGLNHNVPAKSVNAQWQAYQVKFRYTGFSTHYTCDGLRSAMRRLLRTIGARNDIRMEGCSDFNTPRRFHRLLIAFALPVELENTYITNEPVAAEWREVKFRRNRPRNFSSGDCELIEHFTRQILPKLNVQDIKNKVSCNPGRQYFNTVNLKMKVLMPVDIKK